MINLLLVYDRSRGALLHEEKFDSAHDAMLARFRAEDEYQGHANIEVVVLGGRSREALVQSHGRYFVTMNELLDRISVAMRSA